MYKKVLATLATFLLAAGLSVVAVAAPASAHHIDFSGSAACSTTGGWDITWAVVNSQNQEGVVTASDIAVIPTTTTVLPANPNYGKDNSFTNTYVQHVSDNAPITGNVAVTWFKTPPTQNVVNSKTFTVTSFATDCLTADASATVKMNPASCSAAETVGSVDTKFAKSVVTYPTSSTYRVTATADTGHLFANGTDTLVINGSLAPQSTDGCTVILKCLPSSAVTYKYLPATNNGEIYVVNPDPKVYSNDLCDGFWVTAASWYYTSSTSLWPQITNQVNPLPLITSVGTYKYGAEVVCGQGDIYAASAKDGQPQLADHLNGPNDPFAEHFLSGMGFVGAASPTYTTTALGCNTTPVTPPTVKKIAECGTYGSVTAPDTAKVDYTVTGNGGVGTYTVTAVAIAPYVLDNTYPKNGWTYDLGTFTKCNELATPVAPTIVTASECGVYGTVTPVEAKGVAYAVTFDNVTGDYTVVATPMDGFYFAGNATDKTYTGNAGKYIECVVLSDATFASGDCVYSEDGTADPRNVSITFDNTASNKAVYFAVTRDDILSNKVLEFAAAGLNVDQWVGAGQKVTVKVGDVMPEGGSYTVTAGDKTFVLTIPACDLPTMPEPVTREVTVPTYDCAADDVTLTTTTYTTNWTFDTEAVEWVKLPEVTGTSVTTHRAMTPAERTQEKCLVQVTDPEASTCLNVTDETDFTSWIRVALDPKVEYRVDGVVATTEYVEVGAGDHTVTADALDGYTLSGGNPEAWTDTHHEWYVTAADSSKDCTPTLATVTPKFAHTPLSCTAAGSYTLGELTPGTVKWTVNGVPVGVGTYPVASAQTLIFVASPVKADDGLDSDWVQPDAIVFSQGAVPCDMVKLAMTGATNSFGLIWAGLLLSLTGIGFVLMRRRPTATEG